MEARDVLDLLSLFERARIDTWVEGGWGIDALIGVQNRDHGDLDLVIDVGDEQAARDLLAGSGFTVVFEDPPGRVSFADGRGRELDLSITAADRYGDRWNTNRRTGRGEPDYPFDGFTYGWIAGKTVACVGPQTQVAHHLGYEIEEVDTFDVELLRQRFEISIPESLRSERRAAR